MSELDDVLHAIARHFRQFMAEAALSVRQALEADAESDLPIGPLVVSVDGRQTAPFALRRRSDLTNPLTAWIDYIESISAEATDLLELSGANLVQAVRDFMTHESEQGFHAMRQIDDLPPDDLIEGGRLRAPLVACRTATELRTTVSMVLRGIDGEAGVVWTVLQEPFSVEATSAEVPADLMLPSVHPVEGSDVFVVSLYGDPFESNDGQPTCDIPSSHPHRTQPIVVE